MTETFTIAFIVRSNKINSRGEVPIYARMTIDGGRSEISTRRWILPEHWDGIRQLATGRSELSRSINTYLEGLRSKIYKEYLEVTYSEDHISAKILKSRLLGEHRPKKMILELFDDHNDRIRAQVGNGYSPGTLERYMTARKHIYDMMRLVYRSEDLPVNKVDHKFLTELKYYLKTERCCSHNTTMKYIRNFKKIMRQALFSGYIENDPFVNFKLTLKAVEPEFLTDSELEAVRRKKFSIYRLEQVRDIFVFCCYTGLAYGDVKRLKDEHLFKGTDGKPWIRIHRKKTETLSKVPLLPQATALIQKYTHHPEANNRGLLLPVLSNQKMNAYLKEIADLCGVRKHLTTHLARHTFATTVTLSNGVSIETVSKMLGHRSIKTTQHYARVMDHKISQEMDALSRHMKNSILNNH